MYPALLLGSPTQRPAPLLLLVNIPATGKYPAAVAHLPEAQSSFSSSLPIHTWLALKKFLFLYMEFGSSLLTVVGVVWCWLLRP